MPSRNISIDTIVLSYKTSIFLANLILENTEGAIRNGTSRQTVKIGYTRRRQTKQKHNTVCVGHHYTQT